MDRVLTYPEVPSPSTVEVKAVFNPKVEINWFDVMAVTVEASSVGSMKELIYDSSPKVVERSWKDETYPDVPSPSTVEAKLNGATPPGPNAVEKVEIASLRVKVET